MSPKSSTRRESADASQQPSITIGDLLRAVFLPPQDAATADQPRIALNWPWQSPLPFAVTDTIASELNAPTHIEYAPSATPKVEATPTRMTLLGLGTVLVILLAYLAQSALTNNANSGAGGVLYAMAGLIWLVLLAFEVAPPDGGLLRRGPLTIGAGAARPLADPASSAALTVRGALAAAALVLSIATYVLTADNTFTLAGVLAWIVSVALWMIVSAEREPEKLIFDLWDKAKLFRPRWPPITAQRVALFGALFAIFAVAVFFRLYRLEETPNEMTSDHVEKLLDAYDVLNGNYHVFFPRNGGREAIQFYLVAIASQLFGTGISFTTLKIVSVLEALALIPLMTWLGREIVDRETGFVAAGLLAISWWHTALARLALRIVLTPLIFTVILVTLMRGIRTGSRRAWVWAGLWMGMGVYAYQALRITPLVALVAFIVAVAGPILAAVSARRQAAPQAAHRRIVAANTVSRQALNLALCGLVAAAVFVPLLRFWHDSPGALWNRVVNRTTSTEVAIQGDPTVVLAQNLVNALGMFNVRGDSAWISALPGAPTLDIITGGLLILGLLAWLFRLRLRRDPVDAFIVLAALIMLLPSALAIAFPIENPSVTRASGVIPIVFVIAAWPLALIRQRWAAVIGPIAGNILAGLLLAALFLGAALHNYQTYFERYDASYRQSALNPSEVAAAVREVIGPDAPLDGVWLQGWPFWHDYRAIGIEAGDITFHNAILDLPMLQDYLANYPEQFSVRPLIFIVSSQDTEALDFLRSHFPQGRAELHTGLVEKHNFYLFIVPSP